MQNKSAFYYHLVTESSIPQTNSACAWTLEIIEYQYIVSSACTFTLTSKRVVTTYHSCSRETGRQAIGEDQNKQRIQGAMFSHNSVLREIMQLFIPTRWPGCANGAGSQLDAMLVVRRRCSWKYNQLTDSRHRWRIICILPASSYCREEQTTNGVGCSNKWLLGCRIPILFSSMWDPIT